MKAVLYDTTPSGVMVQIHHASPSDEEWGEMVAYLADNMPRFIGVLAIATGDGGPTASQRRTLNGALETMPESTPFVMLTDSRIVRGLLTALNWLTGRGRHTHVFSGHELDRGLEAMRLTPEQAHEARELVNRLMVESHSPAA